MPIVDGALVLYAVMYDADDYRGKFILRPQRIGPGYYENLPLAAVADTLDAVRAHVPPGSVWLDRSDDDELHIVEVWI